MTKLLGMILALASAIANGTFTVPSKLPPLSTTPVSPYIFNLYLNLGISLSSFLLLPFLSLSKLTFFTLPGLVSGLFLSLSSLNALKAVSLIGISISSSIWCGTAVLTSFFFGEFFQERVSNLPLASLSLLVLLGSICGMAYAEKLSERETEKDEEEEREERGERGAEERGEEYQQLNGNQGEPKNKHNFGKGVTTSIFTGVFGGLVLAPENFASPEASGLGFIPSFGVGILIFGIIVNLFPSLIERQVPNFRIKEAAPLGLLAGLIWNISNLCSLLAIKEVGYGVAYPTMQCGLFVSGIWGICLFGEIKGRSQIFYWISGIVLLCGVMVLSYAK